MAYLILLQVEGLLATLLALLGAGSGFRHVGALKSHL